MKKLLVIAFAAMLALSVAVVASAAEITTTLGGDFYYYFDSSAKFVRDSGSSFMCGAITTKLTEGNTWAKLWLNLDSWTKNIGNQAGTGAPNAMYFAAGVDKIGDIFSFYFSSKSMALTNIGMAPLCDLFNDFKSDPFFNTNSGFDGSIGFVAENDTFAIKGEILVLNENPIDKFAVNATFKFDNGSVYGAYFNDGTTDDSNYLAGIKFNTGDYKFTAEFIGDYDNAGLTDHIGALVGDGSAVQANVAYNNLSVTLLYTMPEAGDGVIGVGASYTVPDTKWTVGAKYFTIDENAWELYGLYDAGAFDVKVGAVDPGAADVYGIVGIHASIW